MAIDETAIDDGTPGAAVATGRSDGLDVATIKLDFPILSRRLRSHHQHAKRHREGARSERMVSRSSHPASYGSLKTCTAPPGGVNCGRSAMTPTAPSAAYGSSVDRWPETTAPAKPPTPA